MKLEVIDNIAELRKRRPAWEKLYQDDPLSGIFLSPEWILNWLAHFGVDKPLRFLWLTEDNQLVALFTFVLQNSRWRRLPVRQLTYCINTHSVRGGYLVSKGYEKEAIGAVASYLNEQKDWDMLVADGNPLSMYWFQGALTGCTRESLRSAPWGHSYLAVDTDWESYFRTLSHDFRRNLKRTERDLALQGDINFQYATSLDDLSLAFDAMREIDAASWKAIKGETIDENANLSSYYLGLAKEFAAAGKLVLGILRVGGEPTAMIMALHDKGILYTMKTSFKMNIGSARISPGNLVMFHLLKNAWNKNFIGIDFVSKQPYTEKWKANTQFFCRDLLFNSRIYGKTLQILETAYCRLRSA